MLWYPVWWVNNSFSDPQDTFNRISFSQRRAVGDVLGKRQTLQRISRAHFHSHSTAPCVPIIPHWGPVLRNGPWQCSCNASKESGVRCLQHWGLGAPAVLSRSRWQCPRAGSARPRPVLLPWPHPQGTGPCSVLHWTLFILYSLIKAHHAWS